MHAWWLAFFGLFLCTTARAQERDPVTAQALFDQAHALMEQQRYAEACARLEESQRLDPGIGTQFHLAQCNEALGRVATAWAGFHEVASLAAASGQRERQVLATSRAARLEARLPKLQILVPPAARVAGLQVSRSGVAVREGQWNLELPVDPGDYQVRARAPGYREFARLASAREGQISQVVVPLLEADPVALTVREDKPLPVVALPPAPEPARARPWRTTSLVVGAVGVAALATGVALGVVADHKNEDSKASCSTRDANSCQPRGISLRDDAFTMANAATASFVVGGVAVAGALASWWLDHRTEQRRVTPALAMDLHRAGLVLNGAF